MCSDKVPEINNGDVDAGIYGHIARVTDRGVVPIDTAPYFINEMIFYTCNPGFSSEGEDLSNTCQQSTGPDDLMWSRSSADLDGICRAG